VKGKQYKLPEAQRERLKRSEMVAMRWSMAALSNLAYAQDDLADRLECIPMGKRRYRLMMGHLRSILSDIGGTIPIKQCMTVQNTMDDMELRMVPKLSPRPQTAVIEVDDLSFLVNHAKKDEGMCMTCMLDGDECRKCRLYQILESIAPQQEWGKSTICPYNRPDWFYK